MQLDVVDGEIVHAQGDGGPFDPADWSGTWAPCLPPEQQEDILCNLCGLSCMIVDGEIEQFGGLLKKSVTGGYPSTPGNGRGALDDNVAHEFSLCEFCLDWLFARFVIPVDVGTWNPPWRPAAERVAADDWRTMKDEFAAESARRAAARGGDQFVGDSTGCRKAGG